MFKSRQPVHVLLIINSSFNCSLSTAIPLACEIRAARMIFCIWAARNIHDPISDFPWTSFLCSWDMSMRVIFHNWALYFRYGYCRQSIYDFTSYAQITVIGEKNYFKLSTTTTFWLISINCYVKRWIKRPQAWQPGDPPKLISCIAWGRW